MVTLLPFPSPNPKHLRLVLTLDISKGPIWLKVIKLLYCVPVDIVRYVAFYLTLNGNMNTLQNRPVQSARSK